MSNRVKDRLREGKPTLGTWVSINSSEVAEIVAWLGFDWVVFDVEHGAIDFKDLLGLAQAVASSGRSTVPMARLPSSDPVTVKRALETGIRGVIIPMVNSAADAQSAVAAAKYPPEGIRGVGTGRANRWDMQYAEYLASANDDVFVGVQCEHVRSVDSIAEIVKVPGIDAVFIGPDDLAASLGLRGDTGNSQVQQRIAHVAEVCIGAGIPVGAHMMDADGVVRRFAEGFTFVALSMDGLVLWEGFRDAIARIAARSAGWVSAEEAG